MLQFLWLCVFFAAVTAEAPWTPTSYPNPMKDVDRCGRKGQTSKVCDPDGIISYEAANKCEGIIQDIEKLPVTSLGGVSCSQGFQVAVALVKSMSLGFLSSKDSTAQEFASTLHNNWGVGDPRCQSGVVFFLDRDDRTAYISTAKGSRTILTDADCKEVIRKMKPLLKNGDYDEAMEEGLANIYLVLQGKPLPGSSNSGFLMVVLIVFGIGLLFVCPMVGYCLLGLIEEMMKPCVACYYRWRNRRVNNVLRRIPEEARRQRNPAQYAATMCAICLDDFPKDTKKDQAFLECGHTFHTPCLAEWYNQAPGNSCPLCRAPVQIVRDDESGVQEDDAFLQKLSPPQARGPYINSFYLWAAHRRYPSYISRVQYDAWSSSPYHHDVYLLDRYPAYLMAGGWRNRIEQAHSYALTTRDVIGAASSSSSSSSSWGGGSSFGGGGGGGSW